MEEQGATCNGSMTEEQWCVLRKTELGQQGSADFHAHKSDGATRLYFGQSVQEIEEAVKNSRRTSRLRTR